MTIALKLAVLLTALFLLQISIAQGVAGAAGGAMVMLGGAGMLLSKGLRTPLSAAEAAICVALTFGVLLGSLPHLFETCGFGRSALLWLVGAALSTAATLATARLWQPSLVLKPVPRAWLLWSGVTVILLAGTGVALATRTCGDFSIMPGLSAGLIALFIVFQVSQRQD